MSPPLRVLHLVGSPTSELYAELSRLYARDCLTSIDDPDRWTPLVAHVEPGGAWRFPEPDGTAGGDALSPGALAATPALTLPDALTRLSRLDLDIAVPQLFCRAGMTTYRSLLDAINLPYVGNPADVMALGADKAKARAVVAAAGVAVPKAEVLRVGQLPTLTPPVVVKPVDADNSLGVTLVRGRGDFPAALAAAFEHSAAVLVEDYVPPGREVRCGILARGEELHCLPLEEYDVDPVRKPVRGQDDKLRRDGGELTLVAKDPSRAWIVDPADPVTEAVWDAARRCHIALGCRDYSLFDFRIDPAGRTWFLEAGLYCSFARQSVVSVMAAAAGIPLTELFGRAAGEALDRATPEPSTPGPAGRAGPAAAG